MRKKKLDYSTINLEDIEKKITEAIYGTADTPPVVRMPSIRKEGGMWRIDSGSSVMWANDAGKALFDKALREKGEKIINDITTEP